MLTEEASIARGVQRRHLENAPFDKLRVTKGGHAEPVEAREDDERKLFPSQSLGASRVTNTMRRPAGILQKYHVTGPRPANKSSPGWTERLRKIFYSPELSVSVPLLCRSIKFTIILLQVSIK
jgi:hypothetical protein